MSEQGPRSPSDTPFSQIVAMSASVGWVPPWADGIGRIVLDRPDDAVNAIDLEMLQGLRAALEAAHVAEDIRGLLILSRKPGHWVAGADLALIQQSSSAEALELAARSLQDITVLLAGLPVPTVAAINGTCLGGGLELALSCDWRVAADDPAVKVGLPEVQLGVIPAAGGCQRLPRLIGLPRALDLILQAKRLSARRALKAGVLDEVVHPARLEQAAAARALRGKRRPQGGRSLIERALTWTPLRRVVASQARKQVTRATKGLYPAPLAAIEAVIAGLERGIAAGLEVEAARFGELASGEVSRQLIRLFLATTGQRRAAAHGLPAPRPVARVGVVGCGFMGSGIAQAAAVAGLHVRMRDVSPDAVARGHATAQKLTTDAARKGVFDRREARRIQGRLSATTDWSGFARADVVIEAVFEDLAVKRAVLAELDAVMAEDAVIATNTSALPIADIAQGSRHPDRVVGMHFFSPVHKMPLLEVVRPDAASPAAVSAAVAVGHAMGKTVIVVRDRPGFYTTRVLGTMMAEALFMLEAGLCLDDIDRAMVAFGWPVGPFTLMDEVGLPVALHAGRTVAATRGGQMPKVLETLVAQGLQGKRSGAGFYIYEGKTRRPNPQADAGSGDALADRRPDAAELLTLTFANEASRCLEEGVIANEQDGDLGAVLGLGFPPHLGGPFRYIEALRSAGRLDVLQGALAAWRSRSGR